MAASNSSAAFRRRAVSRLAFAVWTAAMISASRLVAVRVAALPITIPLYSSSIPELRRGFAGSPRRRRPIEPKARRGVPKTGSGVAPCRCITPSSRFPPPTPHKSVRTAPTPPLPYDTGVRSFTHVIPDLYDHHIIDAGKQPQFLVLVSFLATFLAARLVAHTIRTRRGIRFVRNVKAGQTHIHHLVPGIVLLLVAGYLGVAIERSRLEIVAILFGIGAALTLDEVRALAAPARRLLGTRGPPQHRCRTGHGRHLRHLRHRRPLLPRGGEGAANRSASIGGGTV